MFKLFPTTSKDTAFEMAFAFKLCNYKDTDIIYA